MKKIIASILLLFAVFFTACTQASPTIAPSTLPTQDPNSTAGPTAYIYVGREYWQNTGDGFSYVTEKIPVMAINSLGKYLVNVEFETGLTSKAKNEAVSNYLTDIFESDFAENFVYEILYVNTADHVLLYVTEEQYLRLVQWTTPIKTTKIIDLTQTDSYKQNGYLNYGTQGPSLEDIFG